jgi:hypothetical protein
MTRSAVSVGLVLILAASHFSRFEFAGAEEPVVGVGEADVDHLVVERLDDEEKVDLDGGVVLGKDEGQGRVGAEGVGQGLGVADGGADAGVVVAEEGSLDGGRCAEGVVGLDVSAKRDHDGLGKNVGDLENKGFR